MEQMTEPLLGFMAAKPQVERHINLFCMHDGQKEEKKDEYAENIIVSSRYTPWNFLPKSLLEQFRRLANVYFLVIGIIAVIGSETSYYETAVEPAGILGPMIIVVLISVIKDGVEDVKRHNQDAKINAQLSHKAHEHDGQIRDSAWRDLHVGDTIVLFGDEEVPADVVVLACGGVQVRILPLLLPPFTCFWKYFNQCIHDHCCCVVTPCDRNPCTRTKHLTIAINNYVTHAGTHVLRGDCRHRRRNKLKNEEPLPCHRYNMCVILWLLTAVACRYQHLVALRTSNVWIQSHGEYSYKFALAYCWEQAWSTVEELAGRTAAAAGSRPNRASGCRTTEPPCST